jgi:septum formation protein
MRGIPPEIWPETPGPLALASTSPRRAALLGGLGVAFRVVSPAGGVEEGGEGRPGEIALRHAEAKARSVVGRAEGPIILGADTLVARGGRVLGKPRDEADAAAMLRFLSGGAHEVVTGVFALDTRSGRSASGVETSRVFFRDLSDTEISGYVATGEPLDKAGAYGVQGIGGLLVERVEGCYFNVVGLPLVRTRAVLRRLLVSGAE